MWDLGLMVLSVIGCRPTRFDRAAVLLGPVLLFAIAVAVEVGYLAGQ